MAVPGTKYVILRGTKNYSRQFLHLHYFNLQLTKGWMTLRLQMKCFLAEWLALKKN